MYNQFRLESLTASLCEKEANIALMELTAPKNTTSNQALEKLRIERDQLQQQQKQLVCHLNIYFLKIFH